MTLKLRISKKILIFWVCIFLIAFFAIYAYSYFAPIKSFFIDGQKLNFRENLKEAKNVFVFPNEDEIFNSLFSAAVKNITFVFVDAGEKENPFYILQEVEIINKLTFAYSRLNRKVNFNAMEVKSYDNLKGSVFNPVIALVHPKYANDTYVMYRDYVIYISGKSYRDFDLATIKFLMIALGIKI